ncbi:penicillin-binding protein, partial [Streptococcus pyogenes]
TNFFAILVFLGGLFGAGVGFGYIASLFDNVKVPESAALVSQVSELTRISKVVYSDNSLISEVNSDLLRIPVGGDAISDNLKHA